MRSLPGILVPFFACAMALAVDPPASQPAVPADQTSPKGAVKMFTVGVQSADAEKVRAVLHTTSDTEIKYAQGYADVSIALGRLRTAALAKYGEKAARYFKAETERLGAIDEAAVTLDGDKAVVEVKGDESSKIPLVRVDGKWKISITKMLSTKRAKEIEADIASMQSYAAVINETAQEIAAGKHADLEAALEAMRKKISKK